MVNDASNEGSMAIWVHSKIRIHSLDEIPTLFFYDTPFFCFTILIKSEKNKTKRSALYKYK